MPVGVHEGVRWLGTAAERRAGVGAAAGAVASGVGVTPGPVGDGAGVHRGIGRVLREVCGVDALRNPCERRVRTVGSSTEQCRVRAQSGWSHSVKADIRSEGRCKRCLSAIRNTVPNTTARASAGLPEYRYAFLKGVETRHRGGKPLTGEFDDQLMEQRPSYGASFTALDIALTGYHLRRYTQAVPESGTIRP